MKHEMKLVDAQARHREHPDTFYIPSDEAIAAIKPGDYAKLVFEKEDLPGERMWVEITSASESQFIGTLANRPAIMIEMEYGDTIHFERHHICDILPPETKQ